MQKFRVTGQIEDGRPFEATPTGWRALQRVLSDLRKDGNYTETKVVIEILP